MNPEHRHRWRQAATAWLNSEPLTAAGRVVPGYVERSNLTIRMQQRRFTRLTNAFSKKAENHDHAVSLFFLYYNYCRPHQSLTRTAGVKTSAAMAAGLADRVWTVDDIPRLMDPEAVTVQ